MAISAIRHPKTGEKYISARHVKKLVDKAYKKGKGGSVGRRASTRRPASAPAYVDVRPAGSKKVERLYYDGPARK